MCIFLSDNKWASNLSFLLAMIGSAVGLGNIWRYPYVLYSNGGGTFYIPYLVAILVMGIPFLLLEYGVGFHFKSSITKTFYQIKPKLEYIGWFVPIIVFMILIYYVCIVGWDGIYFILSFFKGWGVNPDAFYTTTLLQSTNSLTGLSYIIPVIALSIIIVWFLMWFISHRDLEKGLGKASTFFVPLLFIMMIFIVIFSLSLPGAMIGLNALFNPDWSLLLNIDIWLAAFGQVLFSLSLGMSIALTFTSYLPDNNKLSDNVLWVVIANCGFENFAAFGVFSILGYMSLQNGIPVDQLVTQGTGLIFIAYPTIFNILGQWAYILGPLFFLCVFFAGITSTLALLEPISLSIQNKFNLTRKKSVTILCIIGCLCGFIFSTGMGSYLLSISDMFLNQFGLLFGILLECLVFGWIFGTDKLIPLFNKNSKFKIGKWWSIIIKFILPLIIIFIWIGGMGNLFHNPLELSIELIIAVIIVIIPLILTLLPNSKNKE
ncbi:MAG: sodium-dependent transporter [Methanobrevibacter sp.]|jgi:NSS family neurotransmitter:Na+ symporter|nr:sodium-dependent transporter [Candidatus Methanoflexus mossambicus]